jgi:hypothetical protein
MCSFTFFNQKVCTVNVHEMHYKFNPGPSPLRLYGSYALYLMNIFLVDDFLHP